MDGAVDDVVHEAVTNVMTGASGAVERVLLLLLLLSLNWQRSYEEV